MYQLLSKHCNSKITQEISTKANVVQGEICLAIHSEPLRLERHEL